MLKVFFFASGNKSYIYIYIQLTDWTHISIYRTLITQAHINANATRGAFSGSQITGLETAGKVHHS
jgi:hypothetical protein